MSNLVEIVDRQNAIIQLQSQTINEPFQLLMQHISVDEANNLPCMERINQAVALRAEIE